MTKCKHRISFEDKKYIRFFDSRETTVKCIDCQKLLLIVKDNDYEDMYFVLDCFR